YPIPVADACASCHVDRHVFPASARRWIRCADCHAEGAWTPSAYGGARHAQSSFPLDGAHAAVPCVACHRDPEQGHDRFTLGLGAQTCATCHAADDPHADRYVGLSCEACHATDAFEDVAFDHATVAGQTCTTCHAPDDPHADQFEGRDCSACHATEEFAIGVFDHSATRFPLDGAHDDGPCAGCHLTTGSGDQALVRYRPLGMQCADCHRSEK
ncbi:MAG: cytochrome c3 family protein, partial [Longimicrobiales bacterium]